MTVAWRNRIVGSGDEDPTQLLANPKNWRTHPAGQRDALRGSLSEVGWVQQVLVNRTTGHVVDGHARVEEAITRAEPTVPVLYVELDPEEEALVLASLDPIGAMAQRDDERLTALLAELHVDDAGLQALLDELSPPVPVVGLTDPDDVPDLGEESNVKPGDLFALGDHRLMCGDSTKADDVARLMDGAEPFMCVTDPPYGVNYDPAWRNVEAAKGNLAYAASRIGPVQNAPPPPGAGAGALPPAFAIYPGPPGGPTSLVHAKALQDSGFALRMQIIWAKSNFPIGRGDYHVRHEPCWYAVREGRPSHRTDDRTQTTLWEVNLDKNVEGGHSTQKPVECMARAIRNHDATEVYDPFLGSGTTIIAAEQLGRRCYAMEIDPRYVAVAIKRWEDFTGKTAERLT